MTVSSFTLDLAYMAVAILADVLQLLAAGLVAASFIYSVIMMTIYVIRNE